MDLRKKVEIGAIGASVCAAAGFLFAVAPGRARAEQRAPFQGRYFAHRGLYDDAARPENSLAAFRAAAECGYGVELDVRLSADGIVVISHDNDLSRMTGENALVEELDFAQLQQLRLNGTEERVPRFSDALDILCRARVPVIVELKGCKRWKALCRKTLELLDARDGDFCVESFDPRIVAWFRRHAPELLRGILTAQPEALGASAVQDFLSSRVLYNWYCRPQFIAHRTGKRSLAVNLSRAMGAMRVVWTARDRSEERGHDAVIFERFLPPVHYR